VDKKFREAEDAGDYTNQNSRQFNYTDGYNEVNYDSTDANSYNEYDGYHQTDLGANNQSYVPVMDDSYFSPSVKMAPAASRSPKRQHSSSARLSGYNSDGEKYTSPRKETQKWEPMGTSGERGMATYTFVPRYQNEISLNFNDLIYVECKFADGWWRGQNETTGQRGYFPANYIQLFS